MSIGRYIPFLVAFWQSSPVWQCSAQNQYCSFTREHTLCNTNRNCGSGNTVISQGVSQGEAVNILHLHNQLRSKIASGKEWGGRPGPQPPASNMKIMEWDDELARVAQGLANQCIFQHECSQCRRVSRFSVGQNLYQSSRSNFNRTTDWRSAVKAWYNEVAEFNPSKIYPFIFSAGLGHYTAMMWANTHKIGCGYIMFQEKVWWKLRAVWKKLYVCNYGPAGNIMFNEMYKKGSQCSACSQTCSRTYPGLCDNNSNDYYDDYYYDDYYDYWIRFNYIICMHLF